jgi:hypothetical protein
LPICTPAYNSSILPVLTSAIASLSVQGDDFRALLAVDGALAAMALRLAAEVPGAVGAALAQAAAPALEVLAVLERDLQDELQALLDLLETLGG